MRARCTALTLLILATLLVLIRRSISTISLNLNNDACNSTGVSLPANASGEITIRHVNQKQLIIFLIGQSCTVLARYRCLETNRRRRPSPSNPSCSGLWDTLVSCSQSIHINDSAVRVTCTIPDSDLIYHYKYQVQILTRGQRCRHIHQLDRTQIFTVRNEPYAAALEGFLVTTLSSRCVRLSWCPLGVSSYIAALKEYDVEVILLIDYGQHGSIAQRKVINGLRLSTHHFDVCELTPDTEYWFMATYQLKLQAVFLLDQLPWTTTAFSNTTAAVPSESVTNITCVEEDNESVLQVSWQNPAPLAWHGRPVFVKVYEDLYSKEMLLLVVKHGNRSSLPTHAAVRRKSDSISVTWIVLYFCNKVGCRKSTHVACQSRKRRPTSTYSASAWQVVLYILAGIVLVIVAGVIIFCVLTTAWESQSTKGKVFTRPSPPATVFPRGNVYVDAPRSHATYNSPIPLSQTSFTASSATTSF